jgi:uncharacterized protein YecE (DUF72 family)
VYDAVALENWKARISQMPWTEVWTFFKHEDEGTGPALARTFLERWSARAP